MAQEFPSGLIKLFSIIFYSIVPSLARWLALACYNNNNNSNNSNIGVARRYVNSAMLTTTRTAPGV